jgi:hypothetical protein
MPIVRIDKTIQRRIEARDGLWKAFKEFVECCQSGTHPPRIYKPSGISSDGTAFEPYLRLKLHHHHLHRCGDPLLVTQHIGGDVIEVIALSRHADYLLGDKLAWLRAHVGAITWDGCEDLGELLFPTEASGTSD